MQRVRFIEHEGVRLLFLDFSRLETTAQLRSLLDQAREVMRGEPPGSLRVLMDIEGIHYTLENVQLLKETAAQNDPYVKARAVVGLPEIARLTFRAFGRLSGRVMESFDTAEEARAWLVAQE